MWGSLRISVIIPAFNAASCLANAIRSVLRQTHVDWRMVVVDDGSVDETASVAIGFADDRIVLIRQANAGISAARNRGLLVWEVDAYLFLDSDDQLAPDALQQLVAGLEGEASARTHVSCSKSLFCRVFQAPDDIASGHHALEDAGAEEADGGACVAAAGAFQFSGGGGRGWRAQKVPHGDLLQPLLLRNRFANGGHVLVRASAVQAAGGFDPALRYGEDWEFWVRIALQGRFAEVSSPAPLLSLSQRGDGAYAGMASDPDSFAPCMDAIFGNCAVRARLCRSGDRSTWPGPGTDRLEALRRQAAAENNWVIGRELIRHGRWTAGLVWCAASLWRRPRVRRLVLLMAVPAVLCLPPRLRGPLRPYGTPPRWRHRPPKSAHDG
jgi:glycosyltransferase involved in cell wall biosynthesis